MMTVHGLRAILSGALALFVEGALRATAMAAMAATGAASATPPAADIAPVLARAGQYVVAYRKVFSNVVAREDYRQDYSNGSQRQRRDSHADLVFVNLPGPLSWATFRDVYEVDGNRVHDRSARLEKLFVEAAAETAAIRARTILAESSRFNLGPVVRSVNIPTLALLFLDPANQRRFHFEARGRRKIDGVNAVEVTLGERDRPTLVRGGPNRDASATGRVWIEPESGAVLRTDVEYDFGFDSRDARQQRRARIVTDYRRDPGLGILVPMEMRESYELPPDAAVSSAIVNNVRDATVSITIEATAKYSAYRRFEVTTEETFRPPR
jgi:hypothetical protein